MSIEKKSLISNRIATKKAIVTKPQVRNVAATRVHAALSRVSPSRILAAPSRIVAAPSRILAAPSRVKT